MHGGRRLVAGFLLAAALASTAACDGVAPRSSPGIVFEAPSHGTQPWLFVSDLHFDPFADPALVPRLETTPPARWDSVFAEDPSATTSGAGKDTNAALLRSSLAAMRAADPAPRVVVIAGDFLAHFFRDLYGRVPHARARDARLEDRRFDAFVDATIAYLAVAFDRTYPHARFLVTIGNNDGYCGDYASTPHSPFLLHFARAWEPLVDRDRDVPDFRASFPNSGAYVARLPLRGDRRVLVTNSVIWSTDYDNECERNDGRPRAEQLAFIRRAPAGGGAATRWWLLTHIPPGVDAFASLKFRRTTTMYKAVSLDDLLRLRLSGGRTFALVVAGHTHASEFRTMTGAGGAGTAPVTIVPSVTPFNGNGPAFAVADVTPDGGLANEIVYAAAQPLHGGVPAWHRSYDFDSAFHVRAFDAAGIASARRLLVDDAAVRGRYYGRWFASGGVAGLADFLLWRRAWCAIDVAPQAYAGCIGRHRR